MVRQILDKRSLYLKALELGIPIPVVHFPESTSDIDWIDSNLRYPCLLKPFFSHKFFERYQRKLLVIDGPEDFAQGDFLIDIAEQNCPSLCKRHGVRFLSGGGFDAGTELVIWTAREAEPAASPDPLDESEVAADVLASAEKA